MSRFFVGQRVRTVGPVIFPGNSGQPARITGQAEAPYDWHIEFDDGRKPPVGCEWWGARAEQLEPILPSGQVAVTLEQLLSVPGLESLDKILGSKTLAR